MSPLEEAVERLRANERQWDAFEESGHCVVLAPPGSGKTSLLTTKLAAALAEAVGPRGAACITMTNEAALELRRRLTMLGVGGRPNLFIGTVHSFALSRVIQSFAVPAGRSDLVSLRLATGAQRRGILESVAYDLGYERGDFGSVQTTVDRARQRMDLSGNPLLGGDRIAAAGLAYERELSGRGLTDFLDLIRHAVELVEGNEWIRRALTAAFPLVYVDEYQDLAPGLDRLVRSLALSEESGATLFAVGDPDQSIYGFSGAFPELLVRLSQEPEVAMVRLNRNYRSGQEIINGSLRALGESRVISGEHEGGVIRVHAAPGGETAQARRAAELVRSAIERGVAPEQIAVLASWGQDRDRCAAELRAAGIPVFAREDGDWKPTPVTMLVEASASWASQQPRTAKGLGELLGRFADLLRWIHDRHDALSNIAEVLTSTEPESLARAFADRLASAGVERVLASATDDDQIEWAAMQGALSADLGTRMTVAELGARARSPGHVMAATIHSSKGLEFDVVVLAGADTAAIDGFNATAEDTAEARRKFYVALTRARHEVHLVYTDSRTSARGNEYRVGPTTLISSLATT